MLLDNVSLPAGTVIKPLIGIHSSSDIKNICDNLGPKIDCFVVNNWANFVDAYCAGEKVDSTYIKSFKLTPKLFGYKVIENKNLFEKGFRVELKDGTNELFIIKFPEKPAQQEPSRKEAKRGAKRKKS